MTGLSSVEILGGGPAGLYTAILLRRFLPQVRVRVTEQNPVGATFGFGVVFSDQALDFLKADDPETCDLVTPAMERWRNGSQNIRQRCQSRFANPPGSTPGRRSKSACAMATSSNCIRPHAASALRSAGTCT